MPSCGINKRIALWKMPAVARTHTHTQIYTHKQASKYCLCIYLLAIGGIYCYSSSSWLVERSGTLLPCARLASYWHCCHNTIATTVTTSLPVGIAIACSLRRGGGKLMPHSCCNRQQEAVIQVCTYMQQAVSE